MQEHQFFKWNSKENTNEPRVITHAVFAQDNTKGVLQDWTSWGFCCCCCFILLVFLWLSHAAQQKAAKHYSGASTERQLRVKDALPVHPCITTQGFTPSVKAKQRDHSLNPAGSLSE